MAPTRLLLLSECKGNAKRVNCKILKEKSKEDFFISEEKANFAHAKRKVAQLVAHYVRDVGVGRSSRLFPTMSGNDDGKSGLSLIFYIIQTEL